MSKSIIGIVNIDKIVYVTVVLFIGIISPIKMLSQEYKYEIGGTAGTSFYMGDANKTKLYLHSGISGGVLFRYNINFHWAVKANFIAGHVSGNSKNSSNIFPFEQETSFSRAFKELGAQVEFNFLPYSDKYSYIGTKPYSPYVFAGTGLTYASGENNFIGMNMPMGIGFKYKLRNRVNIGIEFSMRKLFADHFDDIDNPYDIKSSVLKNKDWYSLTLIFMTWEFSSRIDPCNGM